MTLLEIIITLVLGRFIGADFQRGQFGWFFKYVVWLEKYFAPYKIWDTAFGILIVLFIPLLILVVLEILLGKIFFLLPALLAIVVLFFCLGNEILSAQVEDYTDALRKENSDKIDQAAAGIVEQANMTEGNVTFNTVIRAIFQQGKDRIFAVLFWFIVLGPLGALLYRLVLEIHRERHDIHGGFADSVRDLYFLLSWPGIRLTVLGYALVGSLVHTIDVWRDHGQEADSSDDGLVAEGGLAAIQCEPEALESIDNESMIEWVDDVYGLINRTLILWLTIIALITLSGWLS